MTRADPHIGRKSSTNAIPASSKSGTSVRDISFDLHLVPDFNDAELGYIWEQKVLPIRQPCVIGADAP